MKIVTVGSRVFVTSSQLAGIQGIIAETPEKALEVAKVLGGSDFVVKAQILAGGRGKGTFTNGFQGGVHLAHS